MLRSLRLLGAHIRRYFLHWLAYRSFAFTLAANQMVTPLIGLAVWSGALPGRPQVSRYYLALLIVRLLTVSYESHTLSTRIYEGDLADDLLRPHAAVLLPLGENLAIRIMHLLIGLPVIAAALLLTHVRLAAADVALAVPALLLAAALRFLFTYLLSLSAFWTERAHGMVGFGASLIFLLGGEAAPVAFLPPAIRPWAEALPFRAMHAFPAEIAADLVSRAGALAGFGWQVVWLAVLGAGAALVWRAGVRRYTAVGG